MQLRKITPELTVDDIKSTISFYRDILGFELVFTVPNKDHIDWALMSNGEVEIMFHAKVSRHAKKHAVEDIVAFHFEGEGVKELYESVKGKVKIDRHLYPTFYGTNEFSIRDNNGCTLVFSEKIQREEEN
jgi:uncharacterized glyoxalase superfamily protein PhnB